MTPGRKLLLQSVAGHLSLLESAYPRKAASSVAKATRRYVKQNLRQSEQSKRRAA